MVRRDPQIASALGSPSTDARFLQPKLRPIEEDEVTKVVPAIRQATANRSMLCHLLNRIKVCRPNRPFLNGRNS